jgi:hypothetical protein
MWNGALTGFMGALLLFFCHKVSLFLKCKNAFDDGYYGCW